MLLKLKNAVNHGDKPKSKQKMAISQLSRRCMTQYFQFGVCIDLTMQTSHLGMTHCSHKIESTMAHGIMPKSDRILQNLSHNNNKITLPSFFCPPDTMGSCHNHQNHLSFGNFSNVLHFPTEPFGNKLMA